MTVAIEQADYERAGASLAYSPFRLLLSGLFAARIGDWLDLVALNWAVLQLTDSPVHLGLINACRLLPVFLVSVPAGILADRFDRRRLLVGIQGSVSLLTLSLGVLIAGAANFWLLAVVVASRALLSAMDPPIRQALIPSLVAPASLPGAIALQASAMNLARILGPVASGLLSAACGVLTVFVVAAACQCFSWLTVWRLRVEPGPVRPKTSLAADLGEAVAFVRAQPVVQSLLLLAMAPMVFGFPYTTMMPLLARERMGLAAEGYGLLLALTAVGALIGSSRLALVGGGRHAGKWLVGSILAFGGSLLALVTATNLWLAVLPALCVGLTGQTYRTLSRIVLQEQVPDHLRGRILSVALMDRGFIPLGSLLVGLAAAWLGTLWGGLVMGAGCILATLLVLVRWRQVWHL